jgi:hypothetical protein
LRKRCAALEKSLQSTATNSAADVLDRLDRGDSATYSSAPILHPGLPRTDTSELPGGRLLRDPEGFVRYHGATSGATFLDRLKHFMFTLVPVTFQLGSGDAGGTTFVNSIGQYQTFDSRPLPNPDGESTSLFALLLCCKLTWSTICSGSVVAAVANRNDLDACGATLLHPRRQWRLCFRWHILVRSLLFLVHVRLSLISRFCGRWGDLSNIPPPVASAASLNTMTTEDSFRHLAFHHTCFALASSVGHTSFRLSEQHTGEAYFKRARVLIGNPLDTVRFTLSDVHVLSLMAFYLIEINRRDAAYMYVSLAVQ